RWFQPARSCSSRRAGTQVQAPGTNGQGTPENNRLVAGRSGHHRPAREVSEGNSPMSASRWRLGILLCLALWSAPALAQSDSWEIRISAGEGGAWRGERVARPQKVPRALARGGAYT